MAAYFIGVDVGTGSVRAGLFTREGKMESHSTHPIKCWTNEQFLDGSYEQSSADIWTAVQTTVQALIKEIDHPHLISGIGFDATCSLVAVDNAGNPVTVSPTHLDERNVILWQDHRAVQEANEINVGGHPVLDCVGRAISPEMEPPKLLWLKRHLYEECWNRAGHFFDLVDYLVYRATDHTVRSLCTLVCKWTYIAHSSDNDQLSAGWNDSFWDQIGLDDLVNEKYSRIGTKVQAPGEPVGTGLSPRAAQELGLLPGTPVATGLIDAHAGGLGMLGADISHIPSLGDIGLCSRLALIAGTSSCHMVSSKSPHFISGVWGPYFSAMIPGMFLNEAGQSASGSLIDYTLQSYPKAYQEIRHRSLSQNTTIYQELHSVLSSLTRDKSLPFLSLLTSDYHVLPDHHGNRSPLADPTLRGMVSGLILGDAVENMALAYLATLQALAYNTRDIIETIERKGGHHLEIIFACGGLSQNTLFLQQHCDITGLPVVLTDEREAVLLGSAILASSAAGNEVSSAMKSMTSVQAVNVIRPTKDPVLVRFHENKFKVFKCLYQDQNKYRRIMSADDVERAN